MIDFSSAYIQTDASSDEESTLHNYDPDAVEKYTALFFGEESPLKQLAENHDRPYEPRPQQSSMANIIAQSLVQGEHICIEAPTGVGKSFAYLVPAIYYSIQTGTTVLVSTETITLQEQLVHKDLPFLQKVLKQVPFQAALAKGRSNYLCLRRLRMATTDANLLPAYVKAQEVQLMEHWAQTTRDGSLADYPHGRPMDALWHAVCSEGGNCLYPSCPFGSKCFYWRARRSWHSANIVVTNHAMLFTDLKVRLEGSDPLLPHYGALVIDEAHAIEDAAANHLGINVSERGLNFALNRLFEPSYARGILATMKGASAIELRDTVSDVKLAVSGYFDALRQLCRKNTPGGEILTTDENGIVHLESEKRLRENVAHIDTLSDRLHMLAKQLHEVATELKEDGDDDFALELSTQSGRFASYADTVAAFSQQSLKSHVYWLSRTDSTHGFLALCSAPLNVASLLRDHMLDPELPPVVLTSATLMVNNDFNHFKYRVGYQGRAVQLDSPFDYQNQLEIHVPRHIPDPTSPQFEQELPQVLMHYLKKTQGAAFVLFTSYAMMRNAYNALKPFFERERMCAMMQGESLERSQMLHLFKNSEKAVLFGTSSFWTGVDVPGDALSNVIIVRLPFPVPSEPLVQARCEAIESRGQNSFGAYSLPEAVIKLRQGAGRLIRSKSDTGILVILDNRILKKNYGRTFLQSLPKAPCITDLD